MTAPPACHCLPHCKFSDHSSWYSSVIVNASCNSSTVCQLEQAWQWGSRAGQRESRICTHDFKPSYMLRQVCWLPLLVVWLPGLSTTHPHPPDSAGRSSRASGGRPGAGPPPPPPPPPAAPPRPPPPPPRAGSARRGAPRRWRRRRRVVHALRLHGAGWTGGPEGVRAPA